MIARLFVSFLLLMWVCVQTYAQEKNVLFRDDFSNLENWKPLFFPKIEKHTTYGIESKDGERYLRAESSASASGLVYKHTFNVYDYPNIRWRWKVDNVYEKGDGRTKMGDDYPIRIYVMFQYDPDKAGGLERVKYGLAKALYGEYPPHSAINYVWSSLVWDKPFITSPFTDKVKVIPLESGSNRVGRWKEQSVNILEDYRKVFGADPPANASLGIMNDSDNTGEHAVSFIGFVEVYR